MIAVDTSALIAIALAEPEAEAFDRLIVMRTALIGAPILLEAHMVYRGRMGPEAPDILTPLSHRRSVRIVPFDADMAHIAKAAFDRYGKGRHPAGLNFGDCMAYAVAKKRGIPLLFKGSDFAQTDIEPAWTP